MNNSIQSNGKGKGTLGRKNTDKKTPNFDECVQVLELIYEPGEWFQFPRILHKIEVANIKPPEGEKRGTVHFLKDSAIVMASALSQSCKKKAHFRNEGWFSFDSETSGEDTGYSPDRTETHMKRLEGFGLLTSRRAKQVHGKRETRINWDVLVHAILTIQSSFSSGDSPEEHPGINPFSSGDSPEDYTDRLEKERKPSSLRSENANILDEIPSEPLPKDEWLRRIEQNSLNGEEDSPNHRAPSQSDSNKTENKNTPRSQPSPSQNGDRRDSSHGQKIKNIPKGKVGGRGVSHKGKGDDGADQSPAATLARRHIVIVEGFRKLDRTKRGFPVFSDWVREFRGMLEEDEQSEEDIAKALEWLSNVGNYTGEFTPDVRHASSFRNKFSNLWRQMEKENRKEAREDKDKEPGRREW